LGGFLWGRPFFVTSPTKTWDQALDMGSVDRHGFPFISIIGLQHNDVVVEGYWRALMDNATNHMDFKLDLAVMLQFRRWV